MEAKALNGREATNRSAVKRRRGLPALERHCDLGRLKPAAVAAAPARDGAEQQARVRGAKPSQAGRRRAGGAGAAAESKEAGSSSSESEKEKKRKERTR